MVPGIWMRHLRVHYSATCPILYHIPFTLLEVLSGSRIQLPSLQVPRLLFLSVHIHYNMVVEMSKNIDTNGQSQVKGRLLSVLSLNEYLLSWFRVEWPLFLGERKTQNKEWSSHQSWFPPFNLRVPGPQDGERGPTVCWVAGSFLQWDLGQCLPQPHGWGHCVHHLQTAWLWGQWKSQHLCWSQGRF